MRNGETSRRIRLQSLGSLVKLARRGVDERRTELSRIEQALAEVAQLVVQHDARAEAERKAAREDLAAMTVYPAWSAQAMRQRAQLMVRYQQLEMASEAAREALREGFAELKRLELAQQAAERDARRAALCRAEKQFEDQEYARLREVA
jgi:hypothetical protein